MTQTHVVVMGVAGSGKTTVAKAIQSRTGWPFAEGDEFHSAANVRKMSAGTPLTDADRWPWLDAMIRWTAEQDGLGHSTVLSCSALRRVYRDRLRTAPGRTRFVCLVCSEKELDKRLHARKGHYMPASLLASQLETLEPLEPDEDGMRIDSDAQLAAIVDSVTRELGLEAGEK